MKYLKVQFKLNPNNQEIRQEFVAIYYELGQSNLKQDDYFKKACELCPDDYTLICADFYYNEACEYYQLHLKEDLKKIQDVFFI